MGNISKNTVSAKGQLKENQFVSFENIENSGIKILILGNSITRHGILHEIGWHNDWGMAASAKEKDYVHILMKKVCEKSPDASFCIGQVAQWEWEYKNGSKVYKDYRSARDFGADIIVCRFIENVKRDDFEADIYKKELDNLLRFFDPENKSKVILTSGFWHHLGDKAIEEYAKENNLPFIYLGDLEDDKSNMAIGLFEHDGVAHHPGDNGMRNIADRIFEVLEEYL